MSTQVSAERGHQGPWPGREVTSGGVTLHVRETPGPDGIPAVYVHGLSGSATNWTDLAGLLSDRAAGTAVDLPGFGHSRPLATPDWSPDAHADAVLCFLAGRGERVHLLGNSLGGAIAISVAARRPELVETLTLVSPAMPDRRPDPRRIADPRLLLSLVPVIGARAKAQMAALTPVERAQQTIDLCFGDPGRAPPERLAEAAEEIARRGRVAWAREAVLGTAGAMISSWALGGLWRQAARVQAPTLVVWGDRDRLVSPRHAARTAATIPGARLLMLPGVGHVAQMEVPERVAQAVGELWEDPARG
ncbi:alpha/beta fold hydrolase [Pseudonocardia broussonetiae]|uniref:Alpha/beta fold hydrolase n=1 Tax=Pseudonocardia broussonetiae TaxID=2736640 RepID=A0A6M6JCU8_9PSEU|nr:alpha/beta fold hydrolase [Pseudonocardia broussonetiae]QJY44900.1 alpha/beta fold hydrolase [Pseudonocardia broussonetiae]